MYRLQRRSVSSVRDVGHEEELQDIRLAHVRALLRECDSLINRDERNVIVEATRFASSIRCSTSHVQLVSFQILGEPIFEGDLDDSSRIRMSADSRRRLLEAMKENKS